MTRKKKQFNLFKFLFALLIIYLAVSLILYLFSGKQNTDNNITDNVVENVDDNVTNEDKDFLSDFFMGTTNSYSSNWTLSSNVGSLNNNVINGIRAKRTKIIGNNNDAVTIMVYMCGSDLEAEASMGIYDLQEMAGAQLDSKVNVLVYTGGSTRWHLADISTTYNQIYRIVGNGKIERLVDNAGTGSMVDPDTLLSFIEWGVKNYEANRYELIFWDHGGGSVSGYGYDIKYPNLGSMSLDQIDRALTSAGVQFDFIAFDACLMANLETALMLTEHADYLIASEESEPGIGWYYTEWLSELSKNTSMPTVEIGKNIADSFVRKCQNDTPSQPATLSVIDLAEMQDIIPSKLTAFSKSTNDLLSSDYKSVANARARAKEFAQSSYVDLVDLIDMANNIGTDEAKDLITSLLSCVKYNNTSNNISNSYGISTYFPYRSNKYVNSVLNTYKNIGMNEEYTSVVRNFASYQTAGQVSSGGSHNAYQSFDLFGQGYGNNTNSYDYYYNQQDSNDFIYDLLELLVSGDSSYTTNDSYSNYYQDDLFSILFGRGIDRNIAEYISENHFDADLSWKDGKIKLSEKQWSMVQELKLNVFIDDGSGYIDLGKDNYFDIDDQGNLLVLDDMMWLAASIDNNNWQVVPYYYLYEISDGQAQGFYGRIPVRLNGKYANLMVKIDDNGLAKVIGATYDYKNEADVVAKSLIQLNKDDVIEFVCDYYDYDGNYTSSHILGEKLQIVDELYLGDVDISEYKNLALYEVVDIYRQSYWTTPMN